MIKNIISGIIFDCDGTLVDSELLFNRALSLKLAERDIAISAGQLVSRFRGAKLAGVINTIEKEYSVQLDDEFVQQYRHLAEHFFADQLKACDGVAETLKKIKLPMAVASNGPLKKMQMAMDITGLDRFFNDNLFSAYEVGIWKPDPGLFLHAAKNMGLRLDQCLVVEDSVVGIEGALAANMAAILYDPKEVHAQYYQDSDHLFKEKVTRISHFYEILNLLD